MDKRVIPLGCKDCKHGQTERCAITGYKSPWPINAPYHCESFKEVTWINRNLANR